MRMIKENNSLTEEWWRQCQVIRCAWLIPDGGMPKELFISCLETQLQVTARKCVQQRRLLFSEGGLVHPISPLIFYALEPPTEEQVLPFLNNLYGLLWDMVEEFERKLTVEETVRALEYEYNRLCTIEAILETKKEIMVKAGRLLHSLSLPRIGSLDCCEKEIGRVYTDIHRLYCTTFCDEKQEHINAFHQETGSYICAVFRKVLDNISLESNVEENILDLLVQYYEQATMFAEIVQPAERLLQLMEARKAEPWELSWVHMMLSNGFMGSFKTVDDWIEKMNYHMDKSCEYSALAYKETLEKEHAEV